MSLRPAWYARLEAIRKEILERDVPFLDREAVEQLFGLGRRQALRLMKRMRGHQVGYAYLVDRADLLEHLAYLARSGRPRLEEQRKRRVLETLRELEQERESLTTRVALPVRMVQGLPEGVSRVAPGRLAIDFSSPQELLGRLFALAEAAAGNFEEFARTLEGIDIEEATGKEAGVYEQP